MTKLMRLVIVSALCLALVAALVPSPSAVAADIRVQVNGVALRLDVAPVLVAGRTLVPFRAVFEALGAEVSWDAAANRVTGRQASHSVALQIGNRTALVNGVATRLDVAPKIVQGRTLVPVRFVAESFGATVQWQETQRLVAITASHVFRDSLNSTAFIEISLDGTTINLRGATRSQSDRVLLRVSDNVTGDVHRAVAPIAADRSFAVTLQAPLSIGNHFLDVFMSLPGFTTFNSTHSDISLTNTAHGLAFTPPPVYWHNQHAIATNSRLRPADLVLPSHGAAEEQALRALATEITRGLTSDYDKIYAISSWVSDHIYYDWDALRQGSIRIKRAHEVLALRRGVCGNYAELTVALLRAVGIASREVHGFSLGYGNNGRGWEGIDLANIRMNHSWVEAHADGRWIIIDPTWNSRNRFENGVFVSAPRVATFFDVTPLFLAQTHMILAYP